MRRPAALLTAALVLLLAPATAGAQVETVDLIPTADREVNSIVRAGDVIWLGGNFSQIAARTGPAALLSLPGGERQEDFAAIGAGTIEATIADGAGGWYLGGEFERAGGLPRRNLVHILADGTVDPAFAPDPDAKVKALALRDGVLYASGDFTEAGGAERRVLAALDARPGAATAFDAGLTSSFIGGLALEVSADRVYLGGNFTLPEGGDVRLAAFDPETGDLDTGFAPEVSDFVGALALDGSRLYVGALIFFDGGPPLQALDAEDGSADAGFVTEIDGTVEAIEVAGDTVYAGGTFDAPRRGVAAVDADSGATRPFDATLGGFSQVNALSLDDSGLYLGGILNFGEDDALRYLSAVDPVSGVPRAPLADEPNNTVQAIASQGTDLLAGGEFTAAGGVPRERLAAISAVDGSLLPMAPGADESVSSLATDGETIYAGGAFTKVGGKPRTRLAAFDAKRGAVD